MVFLLRGLTTRCQKSTTHEQRRSRGESRKLRFGSNRTAPKIWQEGQHDLHSPPQPIDWREHTTGAVHDRNLPTRSPQKKVQVPESYHRVKVRSIVTGLRHDDERDDDRSHRRVSIMSSLDAGWFRLITNILIQSHDLAMIARWHQCGTMTSQMLARASFPPSVWPPSRSNFDLGPSPSDSTEKLYHIRAYDFGVQFSFNEFRVIFFWPSTAILFLAGRQWLQDCAKHISAGWKEKQVKFVLCAMFKAVRANFLWPGFPWQRVEKYSVGCPKKIVRNSSIVPGYKFWLVGALCRLLFRHPSSAILHCPFRAVGGRTPLVRLDHVSKGEFSYHKVPCVPSIKRKVCVIRGLFRAHG